MDAPQQVRALALGRVAIGVTAMVAPGVVSRPWIGPDADRPGTRVLARAMGGRDAALGLGAILALRHDAPVRGWVEAGVLADATDVLITLLGLASLPRRTALGVVALAGSAVVMGRKLAASID